MRDVPAAVGLVAEDSLKLVVKDMREVRRMRMRVRVKGASRVRFKSNDHRGCSHGRSTPHAARGGYVV